MKDKKNKRFEQVHKESFGLSEGLRVFKDTETGVQYLSDGYNGGLTVLVDKDGKPLISPPDDSN